MFGKAGKHGGKQMRLDKYLKITRVIKRRTVANGAADAGRVTVNGRVAKACTNVKPGDILEINFGEKTLRIKALQTENLSQNASDAYEILGEEDD